MHEPVKITLDCHMRNVDDEADLVSCAAQLFNLFRDRTTAEQRSRVAKWLSARMEDEMLQGLGDQDQP